MRDRLWHHDADPLTFTRGCAQHFLECVLGPGPQEVNIASADEPYLVPRVQAYLDLYTGLVLEFCDADPDRLTVLAQLVAEVLGSAAGDSWPDGQLWAVAEDLVARAYTRVREAGADIDPKARQRLLAGVRHHARSAAVGSGGVERQRALDDELLTELARLD